MESTFSRSTEAAATQWCVVYDARTGKAVHTHQVVQAGGQRPGSREELEREALQAAAQRHPRESLRVTHPPRDIPLDPGLDYHVDVQSGTLRTVRVDLAAVRRGRKRGGGEPPRP